jgi:replication factor C subunit 1
VKREPTPELEETSTSAFFATSNKPKRSEPVKKKPAETPNATPKKPNGRVSKIATPASHGRASGRAKKPVTSYAERDDEDEFPDDDLEAADDIFEEDVKGKKEDDHVEVAESDDDLMVKLPHRGTPKTPAKLQQKIKENNNFDSEDEDVDMKDLDAKDDFLEPDENEQPSKSKLKKISTAGRKRKSPGLDEDEEDDDDEEDEEQK